MSTWTGAKIYIQHENRFLLSGETYVRRNDEYIRKENVRRTYGKNVRVLRKETLKTYGNKRERLMGRNVRDLRKKR